jgi:glycosyltransferase involved in cell wall biosynthesis
VGTLPPPTTGQTIATKRMLEYLAPRCDLRSVEIGHARHHSGLRWRFIKARKSLLAALRIGSFDASRGDVVYMVANSRGGLWYDLAIASAARWRGYRIVLHHQVYSYLNERDVRFALLNRAIGRDAAHVVLSEEMAERLRGLYGAGQRVYCIPNVVAVDQFRREPATPDAPRSPGPLRLGHLANLTLEKGLDAVVEVFRALRAGGCSVRLVIAGPVRTREAGFILESLAREYPDDVEHPGAIYGEVKQRFYDSIDALLLPTRYRNEAQPLVICEALLSGVPVLAYGRACIPALVGTTGGLVVDPADDFTTAAVPLLESWSREESLLLAARSAARRRGESLRADAAAKLATFLDDVCPPSESREAARERVAAAAAAGPYAAGSVTVST